MDRALEIGSDIAIALRIAGLRLRGQMQYRMSFTMQIVGNFLINAVEVMVLWSLFQHFESLGGWSLAEVLFLHGLSMTMFGIGDTLSNGIQQVPTLIREGAFDRTLVRPMSSWTQSVVNEVSLRHVGLLTQGLLLLGIGMSTADVGWTAAKLAYLPVVIASGVALFCALFTVEAIISFWTVNSIEVVNAFTYGGSDLGQYPIHIFRRGLRFIFLWVVPIGFVTYYPAVYLLEKDDPLGAPLFVSFLAPVAALAFCVVIGFGWQVAIRHYRSTGS